MRRHAPWVAALATIVILLSIWGSLRQTSALHDEAAYLLQARLFASGRWTAPARPLPEFFEQFHVLSAPVTASKYWPGHSLLLAPGIWLGLPALMPLLLAGAIGGLLYALAARLAGHAVAALAWFFWITAPGVLFFGPTYYSELTTGALWLAGWEAMLRWRESRHPAWLALVALSVGWGAITRPLTTVAYAAPIVVVVLRDVARRRAWRELAAPLVVGFACLAIVPLWSARTTGSWRHTPYTAYTSLYVPFDRPGLGIDSTPPQRLHPPDMQLLNAEIAAAHRVHTLGALPKILVSRLWAIGHEMWGGQRLALLPFAAFALFIAPAEALVALGTGVLLVLAYLAYAYEGPSTLYYFELQPVLAFFSAAGLVAAARRLPHRRWTAAWRWTFGVVYGLAALSYLVVQVQVARAKHDWVRIPQRAFAQVLRTLPPGPAMVFVRYAPDRNVHLGLIENGPDLGRERLWTVHDLGADDLRLERRFPERPAWLYDQASGSLVRLPKSPSPGGAPEPARE